MIRFAGYAALFGTRDAARDAIRPGAFTQSLAALTAPLPLFWQHRADRPIGWVEHLAEDSRGLRVIAAIENPQGGAGLALQRGAVTGLSFGYRTRHAHHTPAGRDLLAVDVFEVSLVTHPLQHRARVHLLC